MTRKRLISIGGGAALCAGFWFSLFQIDINFPWALAIGALLFFWAAGLGGLYLRAPAGRFGRLGAALSLGGLASYSSGCCWETRWMISGGYFWLA